MSSLETYSLRNEPGMAQPFVPAVVLVEKTKNGPMLPGSIVTHISDADAKGMVVAINDREVSVVWSIAPKLGFVFPSTHRVSYPSIASQLVSIQPMPMPSSTIFYQDFSYNNKQEKPDDENEPSGSV